MLTVIEQIIKRVIDSSIISSSCMTMANDAVVDTYGVMLAGAREQPVIAVLRAYASQFSPQGAASIVGGLRAPLPLAALINGTAAHSLDFDDNFHPARAHASAVLVPALLAVASHDRRVSGEMFLRAYLCGLEAQAAVGFGVVPSHYNIGWHATSTIGCIGTAAAVAQLLGATPHEMAHAMSLAVSLACGPKGQFGTMAKPLHAGIAARNAVEAALFAKAGMQGRLDILEGHQGFLALCGGAEARGWHDLSFAPAHSIQTRGLVTKRHPCCASTHRAIDALLVLKQQYGLRLEDIVSIETKVGVSAQKNLAYPDPKNEMEARFSMQYCLAAAFIYDQLKLSDFTMPAVLRPNVKDLMARISMTAYTPEQERGVERLPHRVSVFTQDGRCLAMERLHAKGAIQQPLDSIDRQSKFTDCLNWGGIATSAIPTWQALNDLTNADSLTEFLPLP